MISNSFIFLDKTGPVTERKIWKQGIRHWKDFLHQDSVRGFSPLRKRLGDKRIMHAQEALLDYDSSSLGNMLGFKHAWRLWDHFKQDTVFLDIETTGGYGNITIIGLYDGLDTKIMVKGVNLDKNIIKQELSRYKLLVTFNGASFDLPVIRRYFGDVVPDIPHIDLRGVCSQIGLKGGLKSIEKQLDIKRPDDIEYVYGSDAGWLWHKYQLSGDKKFLDILIRYNEEDIINLKPLAEHAVNELWKRTFLEKQL